VNGDDVIADPNGVPSMVETMVLIDDMVGVGEASRPHMCGTVTMSEVCVGLVLSTEKDVEEATVELGPSIDKGGAVIPKVGLLGSKMGKG
jgi:hypothetical protein